MCPPVFLLLQLVTDLGYYPRGKSAMNPLGYNQPTSDLGMLISFHSELLLTCFVYEFSAKSSANRSSVLSVYFKVQYYSKFLFTENTSFMHAIILGTILYK